jgi:hypothetical protein
LNHCRSQFGVCFIDKHLRRIIPIFEGVAFNGIQQRQIFSATAALKIGWFNFIIGSANRAIDFYRHFIEIKN